MEGSAHSPEQGLSGAELWVKLTLHHTWPQSLSLCRSTAHTPTWPSNSTSIPQSPVVSHTCRLAFYWGPSYLSHLADPCLLASSQTEKMSSDKSIPTAVGFSEGVPAISRVLITLWGLLLTFSFLYSLWFSCRKVYQFQQQNLILGTKEISRLQEFMIIPRYADTSNCS